MATQPRAARAEHLAMLPRPIIPGRSYLVTRRCTQRQYLLLPNPATAQTFLFCLALAARATGVKLHVVVVMSNHYHLVVTDPDGRLPEFTQILNKFVAKCLNARYGRWENLWAAGVQPSHVELGDDVALLDKAVYAITNPVAAGLVTRSAHWPGVLLWKPGVHTVRRPDWFFRDDGKVPDELEIKLEPLPFAETVTRADAIERVSVAIEQREVELRRRAAEVGRRFGTVRDLKRLRHTDAPATEEPRRGLSPRAASRNRPRRVKMLQRLRDFVEAYREALRKWRAGIRDVAFPYGCYKLKRDLGVPCADC